MGFAHRASGLARPCVRREDDAGAHHHGARRQDARAVDVGDELGDVLVGGLGEDLLCAADLHDASGSHHCDPVAEVHRLVEVVGDEDDRLAELLLDLDELLLHLAADQRVERREGLVHEQDVGVGGERTGEPDALTHPAGEL